MTQTHKILNVEKISLMGWGPVIWTYALYLLTDGHQLLRIINEFSFLAFCKLVSVEEVLLFFQASDSFY